MIIGIGVDLLSTKRIEQVFKRRGQAFSDLVLGPDEIICLKQKTFKIEYLACCWTFKEAFIKALGSDLASSLSWQDIQYLENQSFQGPYIVKKPFLNKIRCFFSFARQEDSLVCHIILEKKNEKEVL